MWADQVLNLEPLALESDMLPSALCGPALMAFTQKNQRLKHQSRLQQTTFINNFSFFSEKIRLDVSVESSARQRIHMKNQALFSSKDKSKKLKMWFAAIFIWRFKG